MAEGIILNQNNDAVEYKVKDSNSISLTANENNELSAEVKVSPNKNNAIQSTENGLFVNKENSVGRTVENGGEIFNDYENNKAEIIYSHAEGHITKTSNYSAHAEGSGVVETSSGGVETVIFTEASGDSSHAEGRTTLASALGSHAEGISTEANGEGSHAEGVSCIAYLKGSHAEGVGCIAGGGSSHAEGEESRALGYCSHAEGFNCLAQGNYSHAEGLSSYVQPDGDTITANYAHVEGFNCVAKSDCAHAEGFRTRAIGLNSHTSGACTETNYENQFAAGVCNDNNEDNLFEIGNGSYEIDEGGNVTRHPSNAFSVRKDGNVRNNNSTPEHDNDLVPKIYMDTYVDNAIEDMINEKIKVVTSLPSNPVEGTIYFLI